MKLGPPRRLDYLVIGHVTHDVAPGGGFTYGGTATYAARTAQALGCRVGILTSTANHDAAAFACAEVFNVPTPSTTIFENRYSHTARQQVIHSVASSLSPHHVPPDWQNAAIVHIGPVARECDPALVNAFPDAFVGVTPQGWMRHWDHQGHVRRAEWADAETVLSTANAVVLSIEDVGGDVALVERWARWCALLVLTRGAAGCTVYVDGAARDVPGFPTAEVDPTGAGDVFTAAFFVQLARGATPQDAARLANCVAATSVTRVGLDGIPTPEEIARCLRTTPFSTIEP
ncbi:MAG: ribokinase [Anaerolineae bacterium]|nr:ribokinase [Anaerolineae bacterium]